MPPSFRIPKGTDEQREQRAAQIQKKTREANRETLIDIAKVALSDAKTSAPKTLAEIKFRLDSTLFEPGPSSGIPRLIRHYSNKGFPIPKDYLTIFPKPKDDSGMNTEFPSSQFSDSLLEYEDPIVSIMGLNLSLAESSSRLRIIVDPDEIKKKFEKNPFYFKKTSHRAPVVLSKRIDYINKHLVQLYKKDKFLVLMDYTNIYMKFRKDKKAFPHFTSKDCLMYTNYLLRKIVHDLEIKTGKSVSIIMCGQNHFKSQDFYEALDYFFDDSHPDNIGLTPISPTSINILILLGHNGSSEDDCYLALTAVEILTNSKYEKPSEFLALLSDDNMNEFVILNQELDSDIKATGTTGLKNSLKKKNVTEINIDDYVAKYPPSSMTKLDELRAMAKVPYSSGVSSEPPPPPLPPPPPPPPPLPPQPSIYSSAHFSGPHDRGSMSYGSRDERSRDSGRGYERSGYERSEYDRREYDRREYDRREYDRRYGERKYDEREYDRRFSSIPYDFDNFSRRSPSRRSPPRRSPPRRSPSRRSPPRRGGGTIKYKKSLATKRSRKVYKKTYKKHKTIKRKKKL